VFNSYIYATEKKKQGKNKGKMGKKLMFLEREKEREKDESKRCTEDYKSNHTRKKNNSNLQSSLLQASAICVSFFFYQFFHNNQNSNFGHMHLKFFSWSQLFRHSI
jgi:hypothetical protein